MSLEKLIYQCVNNEPKAQEEIYRLFAGKLFALSLKYSRNRQEAEDNLQDGFITIFNKVNQFKNKGSFEGWMKRIVINTALQKYRNKSVLNLVNEENIAEEVSVEVEEEEVSLDYLLSVIQKLPNQYRLVFNLYVLDGYSHKEVAKELNISEGTSKSNLSRARSILRKQIELDQQQSKGNIAYQ
ncbi:MAG TPA: sigma-70 family RNA polymerase sigma factor [Lutibacter sp.]|nr:sigma-70 family RNA polymerase sigma factor [Lutibacter sp.]